jgi:hypothetical protein
MQKIRKKIPERASAFVNIKTGLGRIEKRGQLEKLLKFILDIKSAEEKELKIELSDSPSKQTMKKYSSIFKENLKVLLNILSICNSAHFDQHIFS